MGCPGGTTLTPTYTHFHTISHHFTELHPIPITHELRRARDTPYSITSTGEVKKEADVLGFQNPKKRVSLPPVVVLLYMKRHGDLVANKDGLSLTSTFYWNKSPTSIHD